MSVHAKIIIDDKEINLLSFGFGFNQGADITGRPMVKPVFIGLQLEIETRKDLNLAELAFVSNRVKEIELHISPVVLGGKTRKLHFFDCHIINWENRFSSTGVRPLSETIHISAAGVKDSNSPEEYSAYWRKTFNQDDVVASTPPAEEEGTISESFFEDKQGKKLDRLRVNQEICLVIKMDGMEGKSINIDLSKHPVGFEYNGQVLENHKIEDLPITSGTKKVDLKTVKK